MTKCDTDKGRGVNPKSDVTTSKKYRFYNRIIMTSKVVVTPLHLLFGVAFHVDNNVSAKNRGRGERDDGVRYLSIS